MTFGLVPPGPFGNPGGNENPAGLRKGCVSSTPSSTTATFTPSPVAPVTAVNCGAPMSAGPLFVDIVYVRLGYTSSATPSSRSSGSCAYGRLSAKPFSTTRYRRETLAAGIAARTLAIARACAVSSCPRYERENALRRFSLRRGPKPASCRAFAAAASGGSWSVTITRVREPRRSNVEEGTGVVDRTRGNDQSRICVSIGVAAPDAVPEEAMTTASERSASRRTWRLGDPPRDAARGSEPLEHDRYRATEPLALRVRRDVPRAGGCAARHPCDL